MMDAKQVYGAKHIARLQTRANALKARFAQSPDQVDFTDERAELKSLEWAINELQNRRALRADTRPSPDAGRLRVMKQCKKHEGQIIHAVATWTPPIEEFCPNCEAAALEPK